MKTGLTLFSLLVLFALIGVSVWASAHISIVPAIQDVMLRAGEGNTPWLVATLVDAYCGFLWFWLWVAYKEPTWATRLAWLVAILLLGNMAMAAYMLLQLYRLPPQARIEDLLLRRA
jgi:ABC-type Fe3+-siderophore transport system permease subunit